MPSPTKTTHKDVEYGNVQVPTKNSSCIDREFTYANWQKEYRPSARNYRCMIFCINVVCIGIFTAIAMLPLLNVYTIHTELHVDVVPGTSFIDEKFNPKYLSVPSERFRGCMSLLAETTALKTLHSKTQEDYSYIHENSTVAIFSMFSGDCHQALMPATAQRNKEYAIRHGYTFLAFTDALEGFDCMDNKFKKENEFYKLQKYIIARALLQHYETVFYLDSDAGVYECEKPVHQFLNRHSKVYLSGRKDMPLVLNTGAFILQNSTVARAFLDIIVANAKSKAVNPVARYHNGKVINMSAQPAYGKDTIYDQRIVIDVVASLPFDVVDAYFTFFDEFNFQCLMKNSEECKELPGNPFTYIIHCAGTCAKSVPMFVDTQQPKSNIKGYFCDRGDRALNLELAFANNLC